MEQFEIPGVTGDWDTGMLRLVADPQRVSELIPLRRGPVQGPAVWRPLEEPPLPTRTRTQTQTQTQTRSQLPTEAPAQAPAAPGATKASAGVAAATLVSRISGMFGQLLQAAALGSSVLATTFTVGNTLPNMIYFLL
ncbi:MAG: hypothetical protein HOV87_26405, partial [Catenulispora sp.]|nr:hypothetical protein [Catenulispora sp.]